jgi:hypothetical protein
VIDEAALYRPTADAAERALLQAEEGLYGRARAHTEVLTGDELFSLFVGELADRVEDGRDNVVMIDGLKRLGKSTLGLRIGNALLSEVTARGVLPRRPAYLGRPLSLERDVVYRLDSFLARLEQGQPGEVVLSDEGVLVAQSSAGKSRAVQALERALSICGRLNLTLIVLAPSLEEIAKAIRGSVLADFWIHVERRGTATVREYRPRLHFKPHNASDFFRLKPPRDHLYWDAYPAGDPYWVRYDRELSPAAKRQGIADSRREAEFLRRRALGE